MAKIVWQHYLDQGIVCLEEPQSIQNRVSYVKEQDSYGKISMRRVVDKVDASDRKYIKIDFGKRIYKDKAAFEKELTLLEPADREYILGLPWPLHDVYFLIDERVSRWINSGLIIE
ncbi:MAG: hypothetical protein K5773_06435 [Pseudobutyrivibrio sp.]|nr:hypothetical protein [Pseudobutyrivibrio sp.]